MGPKDRYDNKAIPGNPKIQRFVWEYGQTLEETLATFAEAGVTAAGKKLVLITLVINIVGNVCSSEGMTPQASLSSRIIKWPIPTSPKEVCMFLGTIGVAQKWVKGFAGIAQPLIELTKLTLSEFQWNNAAEKAMKLLQNVCTTFPALRTLDYEGVRANAKS